MAIRKVLLLAIAMVIRCSNAEDASGILAAKSKKAIDNIATTNSHGSDDLKTAASNAYSSRYSNWDRYPYDYGSSYGSNVGVTGYGYGIDDRYRYGGASKYDTNAYNSYDAGYSGSGYSDYTGNRGRYYGSNTGYGSNAGYAGTGYGYTASYENNGYSNAADYAGTGYGNAGYAGSGYGGYGGYTGNAGLNSYYGYNNPYYQGANHLGYGYYKRTGYGSIYNNGVTPSLVTGYRGYSKK